MSGLRLSEALQKTSRSGGGLSSVWLVVVALVLVQVLHDSFGWLPDATNRVGVGFIGGVLLMMILRRFRGGRY